MSIINCVLLAISTGIIGYVYGYRRRFDPERMVREFHKMTSSTIGGTPAIRDSILRLSLIKEEVLETELAICSGDLIATADGLGDIVYVCIGAAVAFGIPFTDIFTEIHRSNLTKVGSGKNDSGKVIKGPYYSPPNLTKIIYGKNFP